MPIGVIDYEAGNLRSVTNALNLLRAEPRIVREASQLEGLDALIFPGVGAFGDCMYHLQKQRLVEPLRQWLLADRPYLGICLGYQLLFEGSEESPDTPGLGVFKGQVVRFSDENRLKIPHMGWNNLKILQKEDPLWGGLPKAPFVYFVHSYFPRPEDKSIVSATADYGEPFAASIRSGNIAATQFHPEKSQSVGLNLLRNFLLSACPAAVGSLASPEP